jgi:DNA-binding CsgD family transcriptional regulator
LRITNDTLLAFQIQFTEREKEVVRFLLQGKSNNQIGLLLNISRSTVEFHLGNIYRKLGVGSRTEAILNLPKDDLWKSAGLEPKGNLWRSIGDERAQTVYTSQAKHFFDPTEEKSMKNRTTISIILSIAALLIALGVLAYFPIFRYKNNPAVSMGITPVARSTSPMNTTSERSRGVLEVPVEASTRFYDEVLLLLRTPNVPFHYAAVFASTGCFIPDGKTPCAFTGPISYTDGEWPDGPTYWRPDGEYGFYVSGSEILVIDHLERVNAKSDVLVPEILMSQSVIHLSPDGRWMAESVQRDDPYASDLVLIKSTTGNVDKLDIGLDTCFKTPIGWLTAAKFLFRCDIYQGFTSKKNISETHFYTYDFMSNELIEFEPGMRARFGPVSPNGKYIVFNKELGEIPVKDLGDLQVKDLTNDHIYPLNIRSGVVWSVWSHDSSRMAIFAANGDIYISSYDGSNQKKIYTSNAGGYLSMEWFPDDKHIAFVGSFKDDPKESEMVILSINGEVIHYDPIPVTDGYDIVDVSPLPAINGWP